jgi:UDP-N-acetylmuramyl pentapeptide phosphotransferase/UDP-N-acetylglucosamine-1-phosphate transferase
MKASSKDQVYYTRGRIDVCASVIIILVIAALLVIPIYLLYRLVSVSSDSNRVYDKDGTATCIGILLVFTLLFSAVLSVFTRAKRHEILGAAAA